MSDAPEKRYRPCVGIVLLNREGRVFVGERLDSPGAWQMPQGGVDPGEDVRSAALRELREETGVTRAEFLDEMPEKIRYDIPEDVRARLPWGKEYCGQEQSWVILRFTGTDSDIDLSAHAPQEFSRWRWVRLDKTPDLIVPFKHETYRKVALAFDAFTKTDSESPLID